jgi:hypothetical protein
MKANLFIIGAPKCGTTAWFTYLSAHRDIFFTTLKEPNFFSLDLPGIRWVSSAADYEKLFADAGAAKYRGDASSTYMMSTAAAKAISDYNPNAKIIGFVREQEDFLPSLHHEYLFSFREDIRDFEQAWRLSGKRGPSEIPKGCQEPALIDYAARGRFAEQVARYAELFPPSQLRIIRFRDWVSDPRGTYLEILDFLGLEDDGRTDFPRVNEAKSYAIPWLGRLIQHPPKPAMFFVSLLKRLFGKQSLGLHRWASDKVAIRGYTTSISPQMREEIRAFYDEDNRILEEQLQRHSLA